MIVKRGQQYEVRTADGKQVLGTHPTKAKAEAQLRAIEANKHKGQ